MAAAAGTKSQQRAFGGSAKAQKQRVGRKKKSPRPDDDADIYLYLSIYLYLYLYLTRMMAAASMVLCIAVGRLPSVESNQGFGWHRHWPTPPEAAITSLSPRAVPC